jgi:hypothetical protein
MTEMIRGCLAVVLLSGCVSGNQGWVTDSNHYCNMSGFSVQAPSGPNWYRREKNPDFPNEIVFTKVESPAPRWLRADQPDFYFSSATAYGTAIGAAVSGKGQKKTAEEALGMLLEKYQEKAGLKIESSSHDRSLGAECITYQGVPVHPDSNSQYGIIRTKGVMGYICLHPDYNDFIVGMEFRNGATAAIAPADHSQQVDHFFKSLTFTPRDLPAKPAVAPLKIERTRLNT